MKVLKIVLIVIGVIVVLFVALILVYWFVNRQSVVASSDVGDVQAEHKILIASQGSAFKNAVVESLTTRLTGKPVYVKIIDVTALSDISDAQWDALVILNTTEAWKLQPDVQKFLDRVKNKQKVVLVSTSGSGDWKTKDYTIETITSASKNGEFPAIVDNIVMRLRTILGLEL